MLAGLGHAFAALEDRHEARRVLDELQRVRDGKGLFAYEIGVIHAALGDADAAFEWFAHAVRERSGWIAYVGVDPRIDGLRADDRLQHLRSTDQPHGAVRPRAR